MKKSNHQIKFGFCIPLFANPGMLFFRTPAYKRLDWDSIVKTVLNSEKLGYDSAFVADHVFLGRNGEIWECMSVMAALAAVTKRIDIIPIHLCNNFRHPSIVAKAFSTMSHISNGRINLFYDYGWRKAEFDNYGIDFGQKDEERIMRMGEGLQVIKGMLEEQAYSFKGKYYQVKNAINTPLPVKKIPIWMGEANNPLMVKQIVRFADVFNSMPCSIENFKKKTEIVYAECKKQARNPKTIGLSLETQVLICKTEKEVERKLNQYRSLIKHNNSLDGDILAQLKATNPSGIDYNSSESLRREFMIGTPDQIKEKIAAFTKVGVSHFMLWFMDYPDNSGLTLFSKSVMPVFRRKV